MVRWRRSRWLTMLPGWAALVLLVTAGGCGGQQPKPPGKLRIGLMISPRGLGDRSFNDQAYAAMRTAESRSGIETALIEPATMRDQEASLRFFSAQRFDAVIAMGAGFEASMRAVSREQPHLRFFIIDSELDDGNLCGISFREDEGAFLCGALAAMVATSRRVGFVGGMDNPVIRRFLEGYRKGALHIASETDVRVGFLANDFSGFNLPDQAKATALQMYNDGCEVIFHAAGGSGLGVISAAVEANRWCIGCDMDQDELAPGRVLTSMQKRIDRVILEIIEHLAAGKPVTGIKRSYGLADEGVALTTFKHSGEVVNSGRRDRLRELTAAIINGRITTR